jgi:hypothetical protein
MLSREATISNFIIFGLTRPGLKPMIYHTRGKHTQAIVTDDRSSVDVDITIIDLENVTDSHH